MRGMSSTHITRELQVNAREGENEKVDKDKRKSTRKNSQQIKVFFRDNPSGSESHTYSRGLQ